MSQPKTGEASEAAHGNSDLQKELAEVLRQRAAISAVLRTIANSPHDLQPIFDTILESARQLSRADMGVFRLVEEAGLRLVAQSHAVLGAISPPRLAGQGGIYDHLVASKLPVHIPDLAEHELYHAGEPLAVVSVKGGIRTLLVVPIHHDGLVGSLSMSRQRVEPFTEKEIELVTDFAAQATIALEIVRRERQLREVQMKLAHANRVATMGQLAASITHEIKQPMTGAGTSAGAALHWLDKAPPNLANARDALARIVEAIHRAGDVIDRIGAS
jgi:GAF domain-containing protein